MIVYIFFTVVCVACIGVAGYALGKVHRLEQTLLGERASVARQVSLHGDLLDKLLDRLVKLEASRYADDLEMEERIADRIEKKWDSGLESIINFTPFLSSEDKE